MFDDRVTSYKYFFFLSLLGHARRPEVPISLAQLEIDMVLAAWYPHAFCRLSLGPRDQLGEAVDRIAWGPIRGSWLTSGGAEGRQEWNRLRRVCAAQLPLGALTRFVPYRLLAPFFSQGLRGMPDQRKNTLIARWSRERLDEARPLYWFTEDETKIVLQHDWAEYLDRNAPILIGWAKFELARYLQAVNPAVPGILEKLVPPAARETLARPSGFWRSLITANPGRLKCIYTGRVLTIEDLSLDHYLPWSFVAHNQTWNLVPVPKGVNSSKSDSLPASRYLEPFLDVQFAALQWGRASVTTKQWSDHIGPFLADLHLDEESITRPDVFRRAMVGTLQPLLDLAARQGFPGSWEPPAHLL